MAVLYSNNAETTITQSISATDTTIQVATGSGSEFPNPGAGDHFYVTLVGDDGSGGKSSKSLDVPPEQQTH